MGAPVDRPVTGPRHRWRGSDSGEDPHRVAERWAEAARRVGALDRDRNPTPVPLVPPEVWEAAAEATTWTPEPTRDPWVGFARILGGRPSRMEGGTTVDLHGWAGFLVGLAAWVDDPIRDRLPDRGGLAALAAGPPPGPAGSGPRLGAALEGPLRLAAHGAGLVVLGGAATEAVASGDPGWEWVDAVRHLAAGGRPRATVRGADPSCLVRPPGHRFDIQVPLRTLATVDPRLASRFLRVFDWDVWLRTPGRFHREITTLAVWLSAVAPTDRAAAGLLVRHRLWDRPDPGMPVTLALRTAGIPCAGPPRSPGIVVCSEAPVLWLRRILNLLVRAPDRSRAAAAAEAAWVRLAGGHPEG